MSAHERGAPFRSPFHMLRTSGTRAAPEWWRDAAFWEEMFDFIFPPEHLALGAELAAKAVSALGLAPGAEILDLGCGPGRVAVPLGARGYRVVGVDASASYLERARRWAAQEGVSVELWCGDFAELAFDAEFDAVLCVFNSFGYFADPPRDGAVLAAARRALRPGGRLLLEVAHRDGVVRTAAPREVRHADGRRFLDDPRFDVVTGILESRWTVQSAAGERTYTSRTRPYSATELRDMLAAAGFRDVRFQRDLDGGAPSPDRYTLVAIGTR